MKRLFPFAISLLLYAALPAQEAISGIINRYEAVLDIDSCAAAVEVADASGFAVGDTLLIIQMQGAGLSLADNAQFGSPTSLGGAGLYERVVIAEIVGGSIYLAHQLLNSYAPSGRVQLVSFPYYERAVVEGALTAAPWDGQVGGVLALSAGELVLNADIDVSGLGFRGGNAALDYDGGCTWLINYTDYRYDAQSIRSGNKGEGIGGLLSNWPRGRGAAANGGGGGNDHNSGGGGGALLSLGGRGGENDNPSFFGCKGYSPGQGGWPLSGEGPRLFLGGGGGAGHGNNNVATDGGNGGGIVLLLTDRITTNGFAILANGQDAAASAGDGGGGGGAGGSLLLYGPADANGLNLEAKGGSGGNANNNNQEQCFGPGGGGSGGAIYRQGLMAAATDLSGGEPGLSVNSTACPVGANGGQAGQAGLLLEAPALPSSDGPVPVEPVLSIAQDTLSSCGEAVELIVSIEGSVAGLQWEVDSGNGFLPIVGSPVYSGVTDSLLLINDPQAVLGYDFRLSVITACFGTVYAAPVHLAVGEPPSADFDYDLAGLQLQLINLSSGDAATYFWDFGDGNTSTAVMPVHTYMAPGPYLVTLTVSNACGQEQIAQLITVGEAPLPAIGVSGNSAGCAPLSVAFVDQSSGVYDSLRWAFPGGEPGSSSLPNPVVVYGQPGSYDVELRLFSAFGEQLAQSANRVTVYARPVPAFSYTADGLTLTFSNQSVLANNFVWNFGDGSSSNEASPVHTFPAPGLYQVTLNATNPNCSRSVTQSIFLQATSTAQQERGSGLRLFPNPSSGGVQLDIPKGRVLCFVLFDGQGRRLSEGKAQGQQLLPLPSDMPNGLYFFRFFELDGLPVGDLPWLLIR